MDPNSLGCATDGRRDLHRNGAAVYEVAKKLAGTKVLYLATTHVHPEHDLGAQAFPDTTKLIRSTDQEKDIAEFGLQLAKVFASRSAINAELLKDADFRKADITFERDYDLDLGGVRAKLTAMGHVWTAPAVQEESGLSAKRSGAVMYSAFECGRLAAGPDVIR